MGQMIFSDPLKLNSLRYGEKEAVSFKDKRFTYRSLNERINRLAHAMQDKGIRKGDKVAFMLLNCNELIEIMYACSKIGAVFIPINARFVGREVAHVLNNSRSSILFFDHRFGDVVAGAMDQYKTVKHFISVGGTHTIAESEYEAFIQDKASIEPTPDEPLRETDTICYLYTGGTTGLPKGAVRSHRSLYLVALLFSIEFEIVGNGNGLVS